MPDVQEGLPRFGAEIGAPPSNVHRAEGHDAEHQGHDHGFELQEGSGCCFQARD